MTTRDQTGGNGYCFDVGAGPSFTRYTDYSGNLSMSGTIIPKLKSTDTETRPDNFTIRVYKRIS